MKLFVTDPLTPQETDFIHTWRVRKGYTTDTPLSLGECIELLVAFSHNLHFDFSDGRFFNMILINEESLIAWEGGNYEQGELIDSLWREARRAINKRMAQAGTFNEIIEGGEAHASIT